MKTLSEISSILREDGKNADKHFYGVVQSVNTDDDGKIQSYNVSLGTGADTVKCRKLAGAKVGDTVMVTLLSTGVAIVTGTVGGDTDAADAQSTAKAADEKATVKARVYYQNVRPEDANENDLWIDISSSSNYIYVYKDETWILAGD